MILDTARKVCIQLTIKQLKHKCLYEIASTDYNCLMLSSQLLLLRSGQLAGV